MVILKWQVYVGLDPPYWALNSDKLEKAFTDKTKALVLNRYDFAFSVEVFWEENPKLCLTFVWSLLILKAQSIEISCM